MRAAIVLCLALAGCASAADIAQKDDETCWSYGFERGTQQYGACRMQMAQTRAMQTAQRNAAMSEALGNMSRSLSVPPTNPTVNCTSNRYGNQVQTTCN